MEKEKSFILKHRFVPKYIKLNREETQTLLKQFNISLKQLPKMKSNDPIAKVLELKAGDVVKIIRDSPTSKKSIMYRVIIDA